MATVRSEGKGRSRKPCPRTPAGPRPSDSERMEKRIKKAERRIKAGKNVMLEEGTISRLKVALADRIIKIEPTKDDDLLEPEFPGRDMYSIKL